jgi:hypothetical protein
LNSNQGKPPCPVSSGNGARRLILPISKLSVSPFVVAFVPAPPVGRQRIASAFPRVRPAWARTSVLAHAGFYLGSTPRLQDFKHLPEYGRHRRPSRSLEPFLC